MLIRWAPKLESSGGLSGSREKGAVDHRLASYVETKSVRPCSFAILSCPLSAARRSGVRFRLSALSRLTSFRSSSIFIALSYSMPASKKDGVRLH